ncbi:MAG: hypothetical protein GY941_25410 [Planctomycetes bacterium]|nr:hypothetical protein [Planctomycetota bacterium]
MTNRDIIQMMEHCAREIKMLRKANNELAPKAEAFDALQQVLGFFPRREQGYGEDLVWKLEQEIKKMAKEEQSPKANPND